MLGRGIAGVEGGPIRLAFRGLRRIQVGGEVHEIREDIGPEEVVTLNIGRAAAITALVVEQPSGRKFANASGNARV